MQGVDVHTVRLRPLSDVLHGPPVTVELLLVIFGSTCWALIGFGVGWEHGRTDGRREMLQELIEDQNRRQDAVQALTAPLLCPVCKTPRSNAEISNGWCANCGVYSDGTP